MFPSFLSRSRPLFLSLSLLTLVMMGGGAYVPPQSVFIFLLKISPPDQTLRPTCKFLNLGIFYHTKKNSENLVYQKFYYINSLHFFKLIRGGRKCPPPQFLFVKTIENVIRLCTVLNFFLSGGCEDRDILGAFLTN